MRWTCDDWNPCPAAVMQGYFTHFLNQSSNTSIDKEKEIHYGAVHGIKRDANADGVDFTRSGLRIVLNQEEENDVMQVITLEVLVRDVASFLEPTAPAPGHEETDDSEGAYSVEKQFISLVIPKFAL